MWAWRFYKHGAPLELSGPTKAVGARDRQRRKPSRIIAQPPKTANILANPARQSGMQTFHVEYRNQNFHSLPLETVATPAEIEARRALVGQLLSATSSPAAREALENADTLLTNARTAAEARLALTSASPQ